MFPMKLIEDYKIISYYNTEGVEKEVKKLLGKGWTVLGSVQTHYNSQEGNVYTQVMIKVADK